MRHTKNIRNKLKWSLIYSFSCVRPRSEINKEGGTHGHGDPSYSRIVHCNQPSHHKKPFCYPNNKISTTKYNLMTFLPKALFEQFRRVANIYFLMAALLSLTPITPFSPISMIAPLAFVVGLSIAKEALEDWQRSVQDMKINNRKVKVHKGQGIFCHNKWQNIQVGDLIQVEKDGFFPADMLLLSSSYEDGICYVETMNLDGETNLKVKRSLDVTTSIDGYQAFKDFKATIKCECPNSNLYTFVGNLELNHQLHAIEPSHILLRDSKLRNTDYVYGVVIFTGHDSKVMQNSTASPSKRSRVEKKMDKIIYILFTLLISISIISSIGFATTIQYKVDDWWYLDPTHTTDFYNPSRLFISVTFHLITVLILYGYLIPISLYISIELVKVLQAKIINSDICMYDELTGKSAKARTSNLNEELGQVDTILSDKTGTLTCNQMDFLKCSIAGVSYGIHSSEVEMAAVKHMESESIDVNDVWGKFTSDQLGDPDIKVQKKMIKEFSFEDERLMGGKWMNEPNSDVIRLFFQILAVCHTAIPELNEETNSFTYEVESPDEGAFLVATREFGFEFCKRTQTSIFVHEKYHPSGNTIQREYKILNLLEFNSKRKRMSVIVKDDVGQILLFCKGADSIIFDRLADNGKKYLEETTKQLNEFGETGLRTLALAYRTIEDSEYHAWNTEFTQAKTTIGPDRDNLLDHVSELIERELHLVGATAVEDKLQEGVPQCIDALAQAALKIWVLTGDKMETAINIGFACSLLRQGMRQINISAQNICDVKNDISLQITSASNIIDREIDPRAAFALIIDGKALAYALEDDMKFKFLKLAVNCASVICCRVSPKQKALVTRLVKEGTKKTTLAIGDGANDVGMIQEADIGIGISGVEGMQAVMASDFSIAQFRFLERLLVVHGHWCYKRISKLICYFFYKNIVFGLTLFYFEAFTSFSGQSVYEDWYMILFNVILTSLPVISLGVFEQDVSSDVCLQFPALYQQGPKNLFFDWTRILGWMANGILSSLIIFFLIIGIFYDQAFASNGQTSDKCIIGTAMFTSIIWTVNIQIFLMINHFTWIQHVFVWGSIITWYLFLLAFGNLSPIISGHAYKILEEVVGPAPIFWFVTLLIAIVCNIPYFVRSSFERMLNPMDHHIIQEIKHFKNHLKDKQMWTREKSKARQKSKIGFTARVEDKIRLLTNKLNK
ncbi:putative Phospholipid-transporting ATPase [Zostera marina]|uniref:Phospholipid-transporting ATPase n=1 Tax=Zostera marina TaxID=29655 RepID=A0A0K9PAC5_ZOSMR|nr:putative Phospholipid-transporting ATPase [Zostera marina]